MTMNQFGHLTRQKKRDKEKLTKQSLFPRQQQPTQLPPPKPKMNKKLKCFLYLLMRDELPCGVVARIIQEILKPSKKTFTYSNKGLAEYADEIIQELIEEK